VLQEQIAMTGRDPLTDGLDPRMRGGPDPTQFAANSFPDYN
jgi:hypothetical protein